MISVFPHSKHLIFIVAWHIVWVLVLSPSATFCQELTFELMNPTKTQEEQMITYIDCLSKAEKSGDTTAIIGCSSELITLFQNAKMLDRAISYLQLALRYSDKNSNSAVYANLCTRVGALIRYLAIYEPRYKLSLDSSMYWHRLAIKTSLKNNSLLNAGYGYYGLMNSAKHHSNLAIKDSIPYFFYKGLAIANQTNNHSLYFDMNLVYSVYLIESGDLQMAESILKSLTNSVEQLKSDRRYQYGYAVHDLLAYSKHMDTLVALRKSFMNDYAYTVAAIHQTQLYAEDQQYEVSKTKDTLEATASKLNLTNRILIASVLALTLFALLIIYLFFLFHKNKKLSQRNELLLKEQNHRVKNNLQMISSLLSLQSQKLNTSDAKEVLEESQSRINSVALLHRMLYEGEEVGKVEVTSYIRSLVDEIQYSAGREVKIELNLTQRLELQIEKVTSLGLIINELLTNSIKHVNPAIGLEVKLTLASNQEELHFCYTDNGPGIPKEIWMSSPSFGNQLIQMQSKQLRGKFEILVNPGFQYDLSVST